MTTKVCITPWSLAEVVKPHCHDDRGANLGDEQQIRIFCFRDISDQKMGELDRKLASKAQTTTSHQRQPNTPTHQCQWEPKHRGSFGYTSHTYIIYPR